MTQAVSTAVFRATYDAKAGVVRVEIPAMADMIAKAPTSSTGLSRLVYFQPAVAVEGRPDMQVTCSLLLPDMAARAKAKEARKQARAEARAAH